LQLTIGKEKRSSTNAPPYRKVTKESPALQKSGRASGKRKIWDEQMKK